MKTKTIWTAGLCLAGLTPMLAQSVQLDWLAASGGAGRSAGGVYEVGGCIGQADGPVRTGGNYSLVDGCCGHATAGPALEALRLTISRVGGALRLIWDRPAAGFVLEEARQFDGPATAWNQVPFPYFTNAAQIYCTVPGRTGNNFYRLRRP